MAEESKVVAKNISANPNPNQMLTYIILGLIALLIVIIGVAAYALFKYKFPKTIVQQVVQTQQQQQQQGNNGGISDKFGELLPLNEFVISLAESSDGVHYLKTNITLEIVENEKIKVELEKRVPQFRDIVISVTRAKTIENLQDEKGKEDLKREILDKIIAVIGTGNIKNLYFQDFMLQ